MAHWKQIKEKTGGTGQILLLFSLCQFLGLRIMQILLHAIVLFFYLFSSGSRLISRQYLLKVKRYTKQKPPRPMDVYWHLYSFAYNLLEKLLAWSGNIKNADLVYTTPDTEILVKDLKAGKGAVILCSHLGNTEMLRALGNNEITNQIDGLALNAIVDFSGTSRFNQTMARINPNAMLRLIPTESMGPETVITLKERIDMGELVVIAADRTKGSTNDRTLKTSFLGHSAWFPMGSFILTAVLEAPVYFMFALRQKDLDFQSPYNFILHRAQTDLTGPRQQRMIKIQIMMQEFVHYLEVLCLAHPFQWYNFYNFWAEPADNQGAK